MCHYTRAAPLQEALAKPAFPIEALDLAYLDYLSSTIPPIRYPYGTPLTPRCPRHLVPVTLSPFASLRVNSAKGLAHRTQRSFAALRMTAGHLSSPLTGSLLSKCLTLSSILDLLSYVQFDGPEVRAIGPVPAR